jgi:hypothetical protein
VPTRQGNERQFGLLSSGLACVAPPYRLLDPSDPRREPMSPPDRPRDVLRRAALALLAVAGLSACSGEDRAFQQFDCGKLLVDAEARLRSHPVEYTTVPETEATVIVEAVSDAQRVQRVTVDFDGVRALDVELPDSRGCAHPPVFSFAFAIPPSQVAVDVRAGDDISSEEMIVPKAGKRWLVVQTYDDLPVETSVWTEQPAFG